MRQARRRPLVPEKGYPQAIGFTKMYRVSFQTMTIGTHAIYDPRFTR
jgi:hypothetical protein